MRGQGAKSGIGSYLHHPMENDITDFETIDNAGFVMSIFLDSFWTIG